MCANNSRPSASAGSHAKLCSEGRISLYCFLATAGLVLVPSVPQIYYGIVPNVWGAILWGPMLYYALINMIIRFVLRNMEYQVWDDSFYKCPSISNFVIVIYKVAIRASFLGFTMAASVLVICFAPTPWQQFGVYGCFMSFFHYSEFLVIAFANPRTLSLDSFMLNHSVHYGLAAAASWMEFVLELYFLPEFKRWSYLWLLGVTLCTFGEIVRKVAIITAGRSFTHLVNIYYLNWSQYICTWLLITTGAGWKAHRPQANNPWTVRLQSPSVVCGLVLLVHWHPSHTDESAVYLYLCSSQLAILSRSHLRWGILAAVFLSIGLCALSEASANGPALHQRLSDWIAAIWGSSMSATQLQM